MCHPLFAAALVTAGPPNSAGGEASVVRKREVGAAPPRTDSEGTFPGVARSLLRRRSMSADTLHSGFPVDTDPNDPSAAFTCPFCSLLCDDLPLAALQDGACPKAAPALRTVLAETTAQAGARINGTPATLNAALDAAAGLLRDAQRPLLAGAASDVAGSRAALALAEACGGVVDHLHGEAMARNLEVLQGGGWMSVNLGEVRKRADLVLVLDSTLLSRYPRLLQRIAAPAGSTSRQPGPGHRLITIGGPAVADVEHIDAALPDLADRLAELRCLAADRPLPHTAHADHKLLADLARRMRQARYGVLIWAAQSFSFEHGDLVIQAAADLVSELNQQGRFTCLPLAGPDGAATLQQVATWTCGFPVRVGFSAGMPIYDPYHYATARVLERNEADLLLWLASFDADQTPPPTQLPRIVLARPGNPAQNSADVFIPVGVPGIDHPGYQFRGDGVAVLPLGRIRNLGLPGAAQILQALRERTHAAGASETPC